ncbi:tRNA-dependent cyclodipeptide synthase [Paramuricea clavata]|uniref:tRNA-dependent cyclodipeptide synthase n=1 Tax=Paramuricea clavata TaxID=317549 RepID=A0A6S7FD36_PARCT|nr:tRNA-dependent cyclodipeptide synthase [Paramuricea clavata]
MEESQTVKNGRVYLENKRTIVLAISPGNPFFCKVENLQKMFQFARKNSDQKILLFLVDKISEHNFRAVGSKNPERSARLKGNCLRNKCQEALHSCGIQNESAEYINWGRDVETSDSYTGALNYVKHLYQVNDQFRNEIQECTQLALVAVKLANSREEKMSESSRNTAAIDLEEGVEYLLKELAFFSAVSDIYERPNIEEFEFYV